MISIVVAKSANHVIGVDNQLPWRLPSDLKWFKETTTGGVVVMGRKTFESIGKPLPDRINVIISKQPVPIEWASKVVWVNSIQQAMDYVRGLDGMIKTFIIGGSEIYRQFISLVDQVYLTEVGAEIEGDATFRPLDENEWTLKTWWVVPDQSSKDQFRYQRKLYVRKVLDE